MIDAIRRPGLAFCVLTLVTLTVSLFLTSALAGPPKTRKAPAKKTPAKSAAQPAGKTADPALVAEGKKLYAGNSCGACHAIAGEGGKTGPELTKVAAQPSHDAKWLETALVNPKAHNPASAMPSYADRLKGHDLTALVAYLSTLKK